MVCTPCPGYGEPGRCKANDHADGRTELHTPAGWQYLTAAHADVSRFRPGIDTLALVTGHGLDGVDVDTKDGRGGSVHHLPPFKAFGLTRTPSGGEHHIVPSGGVGSRSGLATEAGFVGDYRGGRVDGSGRGLLYLPGSSRPKYAGRPYVEESPWDIDACLAADPDPDLCAALLAAGASSEPSAAGYVDESPERDPADGVHPYAVAAVRDELARLDECDLLGWDRPWDSTTFEVACNLIEFANSRWSGYSLETAEADFMEHAPADEAFGSAAHAAKWRSARAKVGPGGRRCPDDRDEEPSGGGGKVPLAVRLRQHIEAGWAAFPAADDGRVFVQAEGGGRAVLLTGAFVMRAARGIGLTSGSLSTAATEAAKVLSAFAEEATPRTLALRVHHRPGRIVLDLAQPGNARCAVVTPEGWTVSEVPPGDVVFQSVGRPLPTPVRGGTVDDLRRLLQWPEGDPRWLLVKGWLPASMLADSPRPMLGFFGPQGASKTTTGRMIAGVLDPKPPGALGSGFGKNRADDETKALASFLVAWDNVASLSGDGADLLSRLVTGDLIERRKLYSDGELFTFVYRRTGVVTGIGLPRGIKPDTLDRLIPVALVPPGERVAESALEAEWERIHPGVLGGVLDLAAAMLAGTGANPDGLRMADFAEALWAIDPDLYRAYADNIRGARADMATEDPFIATLVRWLEAEPGRTWEGTSTDARHAAGFFIEDPSDQWWPRNPRRFSEEINRAAELLAGVGITVTSRTTSGRTVRRFTLRDQEAS